MLPHYSPLKVAETLQHRWRGLFPGRIDLGLGRAPGTDPLTTFALQRDRRQAAPDDFPAAARRAARPTSRTRCPPTTRSRGSRDAARACPERPSRGCSAPRRRARSGPAELGLPYAFADFINPRRRGDRRRLPRALRRRRARAGAARWPSACRAICADTDEEAERLAASEPHGAVAAAPRPADPGARRSTRRCASSSTRERSADARPPARSIGSPGDGARAGSRRSPTSTAPTR